MTMPFFSIENFKNVDGYKFIYSLLYDLTRCAS